MERLDIVNERALLELMSRTGYTMLQENGQRKYGGPPPNWEGPPPPKGCEVFVGKIPRDCYEDELVPAFEKIGKIYELRLMMDFSGTNRGYAFVMYTNKRDAQKAVRQMNNYEIRKGRLIGVCQSVDNCRLFVGGIPKTKAKDEILSEMKKVTDGVVDVIVYPSAMDKSKNRGFAFVEYESHRTAAMARRKLIPGRIQLWGHQIAVDWAEPEQEIDEDVMRKVKILYVRNLMLSTTEETILAAFTKACGTEGVIERVKKIKDYAFVHFNDRDLAIKAMDVLNDTLLDNSRIEVVLAKPVIDKAEYLRYARTKNALPQSEEDIASCIAEMTETFAYNFQIRDPSTGLINPMFAAQQTFLAGRGIVRGRGRGAAGLRGAGARNFMFRNPRYPPEVHLYDVLPGMELTPTNPLTLKTHSEKSYTQILEEVCQKNGWGPPSYQLHSTMSTDGSGDVQLFLYKVMIPGLNTPPFQPNKLCRTVDEAKNYASEFVLQQLNIPIEGGEMYPGRAITMPMPLGMPPQGLPPTPIPEMAYTHAMMKMPPTVPPPPSGEMYPGRAITMPMPLGMPPQGLPPTPIPEMAYTHAMMKMPPTVPPPPMAEQFYHQAGYHAGPPVSTIQAAHY